MSDEIDGLDYANGAWAVVFLVDGSTGSEDGVKRWSISPMIGLSRWGDRSKAEAYASERAQQGFRSKVINWGDDLLTDGRPASCPELMYNARVQQALNIVVQNGDG